MSACTDAVNGIQVVVFILNAAVRMQVFFLQGITHSRYPLRHFGTVRNGSCTKLRRVGPWTQYRNGAGIVFGKHLLWYDVWFEIWMGNVTKSYRIPLCSRCIVSSFICNLKIRPYNIGIAKTLSATGRVQRCAPPMLAAGPS